MSRALDDWIEDRLDVIHRAGSEIRLRSCLFCGRARTMKVNLDKLRFICHHGECDERGGLVKLVAAAEECSTEEAIRIVGNLMKGVVKAKPLSALRDLWEDYTAGEPLKEDRDDRNLKIPLPEEFVPCWDGKKWRIPKLLTDRRVRRDDILRWGIGYCPRGDYGGRVVVPVRCDGLSSFVARDTVKGDPSRPKYKNPDSAGQEFMLFGFDEVAPGRVIAVEGVFDAIRLWSYGFQSVAYFGDHLTPSQVALLLKRRPIDLILMPDGNDPAAKAKAIHQARSLETQFASVRVALLDEGDPDEVGRAVITRAVEEARKVRDHDAVAVRFASRRRHPFDD